MRQSSQYTQLLSAMLGYLQDAPLHAPRLANYNSSSVDAQTSERKLGCEPNQGAATFLQEICEMVRWQQ